MQQKMIKVKMGMPFDLDNTRLIFLYSHIEKTNVYHMNRFSENLNPEARHAL